MGVRFSLSRLIAFSWLVLVIFIVLLAVRKDPSFDSSLISLLPTSEQKPLVQHAVDKIGEKFSKRLIMLVAGQDEEDVRSAVSSLAKSLSNTNTSITADISDVIWQVDDDVVRLQNELYLYRFSVLDANVRSLLQTKDYKQLFDKALFRLYSPMPMGGGSIIEDPFGFFSELSLNRYGGLNVEVLNTMLKVVGTEEPTYMLIANLSEEPYSPAVQDRILSVIADQKKLLSESNISLKMSGMLLHAAAGARQARSEISTIGIGSLLGIVFIMFFIFGRIKPLLLILLAVMIGCLTAASVTMLVFDKVHLITFAFGAGLVGVSIDYSLHFLCERQISSSAKILKIILPGLLMALFSSTMAYAAQALTPFPGLRQMAVFSAVGLVSAWITVVLWFPLLTKLDRQHPIILADKLRWLRDKFPLIKGNYFLSFVLALLLIFSIKSLLGSKSSDDIRLLQTSPASLISQEENVRKTLGISSSSQFILISGGSIEECLQKEEEIIIDLEDLKATGYIEGYQALSSMLPSLARQKENSKFVANMYQQKLVAYFEQLKLSEEKLSDARISFEQNKTKFLTLEVWMEQKGSESWKDLIVMQTEKKSATVIRINSVLNDDAKQKLIILSENEPDVFFVDQVKNISDLISSYRAQVGRLVLLAYTCVLLVLLLRYKRQIWRVMLPPILASIFTLAVIVQIEGGINLFHLMALILVLGIGLDMGIFLFENNESSHTWLAVSLSTLTSLLAFGLLSLSETPVLHHFGLTVLVGLSFVWLLATLVRKNNSGEVYS